MKDIKAFNSKDKSAHSRFKKFSGWMLSSTKLKDNGISNKMRDMQPILDAILIA